MITCIWKSFQPIVTVVVAPYALSMAILYQKKSYFYFEHADCIVSEEPFIVDGMLVNSMYFVSCLQKFLKHYFVSYPFLVLCLEDAGIQEQVVALQTELPKLHHVLQNLSSDEVYCWDFQPLFSSRSDGKTYYYVCSLEQEKLMQYYRATLKASLSLLQIIPYSAALLQAGFLLNSNYAQEEHITSNEQLYKVTRQIADSPHLRQKVKKHKTINDATKYDVVHMSLCCTGRAVI